MEVTLDDIFLYRDYLITTKLVETIKEALDKSPIIRETKQKVGQKLEFEYKLNFATGFFEDTLVDVYETKTLEIKFEDVTGFNVESDEVYNDEGYDSIISSIELHTTKGNFTFGYTNYDRDYDEDLANWLRDFSEKYDISNLVCRQITISDVKPPFILEKVDIKSQ